MSKIQKEREDRLIRIQKDATLGASGEELESKRGWLLYVTLDTGYLRCRCSFRGKRYVWGTRGEGVIVHA